MQPAIASSVNEFGEDEIDGDEVESDRDKTDMDKTDTNEIDMDEDEDEQLVNLDSPIWQNLPQDLIGEVVSWLVVGRQEDLERWPVLRLAEDSLWRLGRVCRHWYQQFIPIQCQILVLPRGVNAARMVPVMRGPYWSYRQARNIRFNGARDLHPRTLNQLALLLPSLERIEFDYIKWRDEIYAHPSWSRLLAGSLKGFKHVTRLGLWDCDFQDSRCKWLATSTAIPSRKSNQLSKLCVHWWQGDSTIFEHLFPIWSLPHQRHDQTASTFPGIQYKEIRTILNVLALIDRFMGIDMKLERSIYPHIWSLTITSVASTEVEVIIARDVNNVNVQGYVRWIIFRFHLFKAWKADELPRALSKLARLEKVVLVCETECPLIPASWKPLKDKVHIWSIAKAKAHAQDMMRNGIPSEASEQFPVSSRWSKDDDDSEDYWFNSWTINDQWAMSGEELKFEERDPEKNES